MCLVTTDSGETMAPELMCHGVMDILYQVIIGHCSRSHGNRYVINMDINWIMHHVLVGNEILKIIAKVISIDSGTNCSIQVSSSSS